MGMCLVGKGRPRGGACASLGRFGQKKYPKTWRSSPNNARLDSENRYGGTVMGCFTIRQFPAALLLTSLLGTTIASEGETEALNSAPSQSLDQIASWLGMAQIESVEIRGDESKLHGVVRFSLPATTTLVEVPQRHTSTARRMLLSQLSSLRRLRDRLRGQLTEASRNYRELVEETQRKLERDSYEQAVAALESDTDYVALNSKVAAMEDELERVAEFVKPNSGQLARLRDDIAVLKEKRAERRTKLISDVLSRGTNGKRPAELMRRRIAAQRSVLQQQKRRIRSVEREYKRLLSEIEASTKVDVVGEHPATAEEHRHHVRAAMQHLRSVGLHEIATRIENELEPSSSGRDSARVDPREESAKE